MNGMSETIDLSEKMEGHVIMWAKGHYKREKFGIGEGGFDFYDLVRVQREWSGLGEYWTPFFKDTLKLLVNTASIVGISHAEVLETFLWKAGDRNKKITYALKADDHMTLEDIGRAYADQLMNLKIRERHPEKEGHYYDIFKLPKKLDI